MPIPGVHLYSDKRIAHVRVGKLSLNLFNFAKMPNDAWVEYLEGTFKVSAGDLPAVSLVHFADAFPDATQRKLGVDFMDKHRVPELSRIALMTDSDLLRGAMTAYGWLQRKVVNKAFAQREYPRALTWLGEEVKFDRAEAEDLLRRCYREIGLPVPEAERYRRAM